MKNHERGSLTATFGFDDDSELLPLDQLGEMIASGDDHGQLGPQIVEDARAERKGRFDVREVRAHSRVRFSQVILPIGKIDPRARQYGLMCDAIVTHRRVLPDGQFNTWNNKRIKTCMPNR